MHDPFGLGLGWAAAVFVSVGSGPGLVLIDRTEGTNFGDMVNAGGIAAAFDGVTSQDSTLTANKTSSADNFVGKTLAAPRVFGRAIVYGSNNQGFLSADGNVTLTIYGKNGVAPANSADGTVLGTLGPFSDTTNESAGRIVESTDLVTAWDHLWVRMTNTATNTRIAELELYEWA